MSPAYGNYVTLIGHNVLTIDQASTYNDRLTGSIRLCLSAAVASIPGALEKYRDESIFLSRQSFSLSGGSSISRMRLRPGLRPGLCWWGAYSAPLDPLTNGRKGAAPGPGIDATDHNIEFTYLRRK